MRQFLENPDVKLEALTLHPSWIIGPTLTLEEGSSVSGIATFMRRQVPGFPNIKLGTVDVRDCALAHI